MPRVLSVSEVRRSIYLAAGGRESSGSGETSTSLLGRLFHETFRLLTGPDPTYNLSRPLELADRNPESWQTQLTRHAYLWCVGPQLVQHQSELQGFTQEVLAYWKAVEHLCQWLCEVLLQQSRPAQAIEELRRFIFAENEVDAQVELSDPAWEDTVVLQGRVDAVLRQPSTGRLCAVELKLGRTSPEADLAQACLYHLLLEQRSGSPPAQNLALWSFQPEAHERVWGAQELGEAKGSLKALAGKLAGVLQGGPPRLGGPEPTSARPAPPEEGSTEMTEMRERILAVFQEFDAPIQFAGTPLVGPTFYRFLAKPATGVKADRILQMATTVWPRLGIDQPPHLSMEKGLIAIDVQRTDRQVIRWDARLGTETPGLRGMASRFPVGVSVEGAWIYADLAQPEHSHILVAGSTGSGKSEWLRMMVGSLCAASTPQGLQLVLVDPKRTAFQALNDSPFLRRSIVYPDDEDVVSVLEALIEEMGRRYDLLAKEQAADVRAYHSADGDRLPRIVCVCDEYADLILADSKVGKEVERRIGRIGAKGRAAGIHLVLATQRPSKDLVKGVIKANLNARVAFKVNDTLESRIILGERGAETLLGRGDLLFKDLGRAVRLQSPLISDEDLRKAAGC